MKFYLGTHQAQWLGRPEFTDVPLFVSTRRLRNRKTLPRAAGRWSLDSGGFSELTLYGEWRTSPEQYVSEIRRYRDEIGGLDWASQQDHMCEPHMLKLTGLTIEEHHERTVNNYVELKTIAPELDIIPVLQGWELEHYLRCRDLFDAKGVDLTKVPVVGVGSVCRRQASADIGAIFTSLYSEGIRGMHGFGVKQAGLRRYGQLLGTADSMAWSFAARYDPPLPGCTGHKNCANCQVYALQWRKRTLALAA